MQWQSEAFAAILASFMAVAGVQAMIESSSSRSGITLPNNMQDHTEPQLTSGYCLNGSHNSSFYRSCDIRLMTSVKVLGEANAGKHNHEIKGHCTDILWDVKSMTCISVLVPQLHIAIMHPPPPPLRLADCVPVHL